jgi:iron complex outermembrane receptor protein
MFKLGGSEHNRQTSVSNLIPAIAIILAFVTIRLDAAPQRARDLTELSIEELLNIEVTSATLRPEPLSQTAAAAFVITANDIRRSGATDIPEALRMVPGLQVAKLGVDKWAISSRGFNGRFANKLLVMIDGRSVYTPFFSGVYWDVQNVFLEDVDRIEVIRGPGATLWGTNAVNGVINIITKDSADSQGALISGGRGSEERGFGGIRYGGTNGNMSYRVYARYFERDDGVTMANLPALDDSRMTYGGFRIDWRGQGPDSLTVQGDIYGGTTGDQSTIPIPIAEPGGISGEDTETRGGNVIARWRHQYSSSAIDVQFHYDRTARNEFIAGREERDTVQIDFQHQLTLLSGHQLVWGFGLRSSADDFVASPAVQLDPTERTIRYSNAFVQYDFPLSPSTRVTLGSKIEHNSFTGYETQPNVRLLWSPGNSHSAWFAVSRAVRMPSRVERDMDSIRGSLPARHPLNPTPLPALITTIGSETFDSEKLVAYEGGWRFETGDRISFDLAAFYNDYDDLLTREPVPPTVRALPVPHAILAGLTANMSTGWTYGFESVVEIRPRPAWRVQGTYTYLQMHWELTPGSGSALTPSLFMGMNPKHQVSLRSGVDLPGRVELNLDARWVDDLPSVGVSNYFSGGARLGWRPAESLELSLVGRDLFAPHHTEFASGFLFQGTQSEVQRSVYGKATFEF